MEEHSVVKKRSVAELAGKFSCPIPHTTDAEVNKPVRRRPPRSLQLSASNDATQGQDEKGAETVSPRKNRNSALIEKLQANLALSPTGPLPFPKSPGVLKLPVPSFSPGSPSSPSSPPGTVTPKQEETPASFENPSEGNVLKSIIKGRARHSIKRRPPSRRHRKSSADEEGDKTALEPTTANGHEGEVFDEQKTSPDTESLSSKEQIEQETKSTDSEKPEPEEKVETVASEKKEGEEKTEQELKEEKSEAEPQLANSTEETCEESVTVTHANPETEPDTTDEKEEEQKDDAVNH